jgi:tetratricopeptide (TPR) repeat protein
MSLAALRRRSRRTAGRAGVTAIVVVAALAGLLAGRFLLAGRNVPAGGQPARPPAAASGAQATVERLQTQLRPDPDQPAVLTQLGAAYLTRARETADPSFYARAAEVLRRADALDGRDPQTKTALGLLALARHDFRGALDWGARAHALAPDAADPLGVTFDAQVELGRYREAAATAQAMVDRKPGLGSFARVSYLRELTGDQRGAVLAMEQAVTSGAGSAADVAYVQTLVGDLRLGLGSLPAAETAYRRALAVSPGYGPAEVGLGQIAIARGDLAGAARLLDPVARRLPLPATVALLGDVRARLGQPHAALEQYRLVRAIEALNRANGVAVDLELARFEAGHAHDPGGDPARAVALARAALRQRPTVYAEDTLAWALHADGRSGEALPHARAAVRLGTRDAVLWYHLAAIEAAAGRTAPARRHLAAAFGINPYLMGPSAAAGDRADAVALAGRLGLRPPVVPGSGS